MACARAAVNNMRLTVRSTYQPQSTVPSLAIMVYYYDVLLGLIILATYTHNNIAHNYASSHILHYY